MAHQVVPETDVTGVLLQTETWSNGTQPDDPPEGYIATDGRGVVLTQRPLNPDEAAQYAALDTEALAVTNGASLHDKLTASLTANTAYLAVAIPTTAQNTAQVQRVTRGQNALIRLALGQLTTTDGT